MAQITLDEKVRQFLSVCYRYGSCDGSGDGSGSGDGYGDDDGSGYGSDDGDGDGYGSGDGYGDGSGYGYGSCDGSGDGYGDGSGYGYGDGSGDGLRGIGRINGRRIYLVDGVPTIFTSVRSNLGKGFILTSDLCETPCYVARTHDFFGHGATPQEAFSAAQEKYIDEQPTEERIEMFLEEFGDIDKKHPARLFYDWHHRLTGSCTMGRTAFVQYHGIDLDHDEYTAREFLELTRDDYGGEVIRQIIGKLEEPQE